MAWGTWGSFGSEAVYCVFACGCARGHAKHATSRVPRGGGFACGARCAHRDARCRVAAGGAHACVSPTRVSPARAPPTTGSPFPLPWKPQLGTGDAGVVVLPVVGAHGPPGRVCEHLQHAALTAHAHWGPGHRVRQRRRPQTPLQPARTPPRPVRAAPGPRRPHARASSLSGPRAHSGAPFSLTGSPQVSPSFTGHPSLMPAQGLQRQGQPDPRGGPDGPAASAGGKGRRPGWLLRVLPHRNSSSPSLQWETPSHRAVRSMHLKEDRQRYFPEQSKWTEGPRGQVLAEAPARAAPAAGHLPRGPGRACAETRLCLPAQFLSQIPGDGAAAPHLAPLSGLEP